jgi:hypothetical protein
MSGCFVLWGHRPISSTLRCGTESLRYFLQGRLILVDARAKGPGSDLMKVSRRLDSSDDEPR